MTKGIIQLCYRKIIDNNSSNLLDRFIFEDSYTEFLMQAQFYNQEKKYSTFSELNQHVQNADKLHFLVSTSIAGYLHQLNGIVPDILNNNGKHFLPFKNYRFEIIDSDIKNKAKHCVAISFFSVPLLWHDTIGSRLLISVKKDNLETEGMVTTDMLELQPFLSISSLKAMNLYGEAINS